MAEGARNLVGEFRIPVTKEQWKAQHLNANQRLHFQARNKKTQWWRALAAVRCRNARIPGLDRAHIEIWYRFPDNIKREVANLQPTSKAIVDGLVDAGLLPDDKDEWCVGPDNRRTWPNGPHDVVVKVFSLE